MGQTELRNDGVLGGSHVCGHIISFGAVLPVHVRGYGSFRGTSIGVWAQP